VAVEENERTGLVMSLLLGHRVKPGKLVDFADYVMCLSVDHGPYVSGALNTIVAARAGKDLVSSLAAGLLTIGPRFGGALNAAAGHWLQAVQEGQAPRHFVDNRSPDQRVIAGIGHAKYRVEMPDPRVQALRKQFAGNANGDRYLEFALGVESITTRKKGNLILNVDGAIAAILLDLLESELGYGPDKLRELVDIEFFNALFVLSRSVGLTSHYLDQRRHDEGLVRLTDEEVTYFTGALPRPGAEAPTGSVAAP
jgi:ATP citrate (pro-S)-lyase